jgi:hypothetical protein
LYTKKQLRAVANPDEYKEWLKQKVKERIEKKREGRISAQKTNALPKVNTELAAKLMQQQQAGGTALAERPDKPSKVQLTDTQFFRKKKRFESSFAEFLFVSYEGSNNRQP